MSEDSEIPDVVRTPAEVATRALALFAAVAVGLGAGREKLTTFLREEQLEKELTPNERELLATETPTEKQLINASWQSEALWVLVWALKKVEEIPAANVQCDTAVFRELLPPYAPVSVKDFVRDATCRSDAVLVEMADKILYQHWQARDASINGRDPPPDIDIEIVQERHHAINWVIGYDGLPWDEVTTDT
jgi:hypothetical protein